MIWKVIAGATAEDQDQWTLVIESACNSAHNEYSATKKYLLSSTAKYQ